jgi:hypothetical protein
MSINVKGVVATAVAATGLANKQGPGVIDARLKQSFDTYTTLGTETTGSTILMGPILPQGALIRDVKIVYTANASATLSVGDSASATRYQNATSINAAGATSTTSTTGTNYEIGTNSGDNQILLTVGGATLQTGATIQVLITYVFD